MPKSEEISFCISQESIHGALLRMNRSIQAEDKDTLGILKKNRSYKRIVRRGIDSV